MTYEEKHAALIEYLKVKVHERDWHGAADACCDLRVMEADAPRESARDICTYPGCKWEGKIMSALGLRCIRHPAGQP